jgi:hypothetical protein
MDGGAEDAPGIEADTDEAELLVDGDRWTVRLLGRTRGGPSAAPADLLLLGFSRGDATDVQLEALIAARSLSGLSEEELVSAFRGAGPPPDPDRPRTLFQGAAERRPRKD